MNAHNFRKNSRIKILREMPTCICLLIILLPVFSLTIDAVKYFFEAPAEAVNVIMPTGSRLELLARSISLSAGVSIFGVFLGMLISIFIWRYIEKFHGYFILLLMAMMLVPNYIHAQSWIFFMDKLYAFLADYNIAKLNFNGFFAAWWVMLVSLLPLTTAIIFMGIKGINAELIEAGVIYAGDSTVLLKIIIPQLIPSFFTAANLVFILCLTDYSIPSLFGINVYPLHIFAEFSAHANAGRAFIISLPLLFIAIFIIAAAYNSIINITFTNLEYGIKSYPFKWPLWFKTILFIGGFILLIQVFVPLINLFLEMGSFSIIETAYSEIKYTLIISIASAFLCIPPAFILSEKLLYSGKYNTLWWFALAVPFVTPASMIGIGMISLSSRYMLSWLYGSLLMPVAANVIRFLPVAVLIVFSQLKTIDSEVFEAAKVFQPTPLKTLLKIKIPLLAPSLNSAFGAVFALSVTELGSAVLLAPPGKNTLTMKIYNYLHYGSSETVAVLCFVVFGITLFAGVLAVSAYSMGIHKQSLKKH